MFAVIEELSKLVTFTAKPPVTSIDFVLSSPPPKDDTDCAAGVVLFVTPNVIVFDVEG